jgi:phosphoenolpyruvate-protein phosphotransferase
MKNTEERLQGLPISGGKALGRVCLFNEGRHNNLPLYRVHGEGVPRERERLERAIEIVDGRLAELTDRVRERVGQAEAEIFVAQRVILEDEELRRRVLDGIEAQECNAEAAVASTLDGYEDMLAQIDSDYIKERASDIGELKRRLLDVLRDMNPQLQCAGQDHCQRGRDRIVVAAELTPRLTLDLDAQSTRGFVTERGGTTSHAGILARALGIPAVSGIAGVHGAISCGTPVLIDGDAGDVVLRPSPETLARYPDLERGPRREPLPVAAPVPGFAVLANISLAGEVDDALAVGAEGIGLYRTEYEFMAADRVLDEDEQAARYGRVLAAMKGKPVIIRLLDIGGDKAFPPLGLPAEDNPALGRRGARLLLAHPELLAAQARALVRAAGGAPLCVLYPMIADRPQFEALRARFLEATADLAADAVLHGVMFEVPAACLAARDLLAAADFGCVGTNDLVQYLCAVDRNNELVAGDAHPDRPVFWSLLGGLVEAAEALGRPLCVCGELAGDPAYVPRLRAMGVQSVSVSPRLVPQVRVAAQADPA